MKQKSLILIFAMAMCLVAYYYGCEFYYQQKIALLQAKSNKIESEHQRFLEKSLVTENYSVVGVEPSCSGFESRITRNILRPKGIDLYFCMGHGPTFSKTSWSICQEVFSFSRFVPKKQQKTIDLLLYIIIRIYSKN